MKHSVKFADYAKTQDDFGFSDGSRHDAQASPAPIQRMPPAGPTSTAFDDLVNELEAALMADLDHPATVEAPDLLPDEPEPIRSADEDDEGTLDSEAFRRLMENIRQPVAKPAGPLEAETALGAMRDETERPIRPVMPANPPEAVRRAAPRRRAPESGRRLQSSLIVGAALVALAGGGAFMTVQTVTAHDDQQTRLASAAQPVAADAVVDDAQTGSIAKAEDRAVPESVDSSNAVASIAADAPAIAGATDPSRAAARSDLLFAPPASEAAVPVPAEQRVALAEPAPSLAQEAASPPVPPQAAAEPSNTAPRAGALTSGPAHILSGVKLRSNPDNGAPVLGVLAGGTNVTVVGCKGWCEVVAGDKRGYVFQKFLAQGAG